MLFRKTARTSPEMIMYDSDDPLNLPWFAKAVAAYIPNGTFRDLCVRFYPRARCLSITNDPRYLAAFIDVEGAVTDDQAIEWWNMARMHGIYLPGFYADESRWESSLLSSISRAGIKSNQTRKWQAKWDGIAKIPAGYDAKQYESRPHGADYDVSIVRRGFFPA